MTQRCLLASALPLRWKGFMPPTLGFGNVVSLKVPSSSIHAQICAMINTCSVPGSRWQRVLFSQASEVKPASGSMGNMSMSCLVIVFADYPLTSPQKPRFPFLQGRCLPPPQEGRELGRRAWERTSSILNQILETNLRSFSETHGHAALEEVNQ